MNVIQKKVKRKTMSLYFFVWEKVALTPKTYDQLNLNEANQPSNQGTLFVENNTVFNFLSDLCTF